MKTVGIIAEFNPFHNGHRYLLETARENARADAVIAVMSGHFMQRGEGSIYSKWRRAEAAVRFGADLVLELPSVYALQSADYFAAGAVKLLRALGVDSVAFGVENATLHDLLAIANALHAPASSIHTKIQTALSGGASYSSAFSAAIKEEFPDFSMLPNHTLALSYIGTAMDLGFSPEWLPIRRVGALHDRIGQGNITSASHLRLLLSESPDSARAYLPYAPIPPESNPHILELIALAKLREMSTSRLSSVSAVSEGLEHRIKEAANARGFTSFVENAVTKRYSAARIRRIAYNALLKISADAPLMEPEYLRVLALNERGRAYIREKKTAAPLPFIIKTADAPPSKMLETDCLATDLWALSTRDAQGRQDYQTSPVFIE